MKKLVNFEFKRLKNKKIIILLPILLLLIGFAGILLGNLYFKSGSDKVRLLQIYSAYVQFVFIFTSYVYISTFTNDYANGNYAFIKQIGYSFGKILFAKTIILYLITVVSTNLFLIIASFYLQCTDVSYLVILIISLNLSLLFVILFALFISLIIRKTTQATLVTFGAFIVFNITNLVTFGLTNPSDANSISFVTLQKLASLPITHDTLSTIDLDFIKYRYLLITLPSIFWIGLLLLVIIILVKKGVSKNEL